MNTATTFLSVCSQASVKEWIGIGRWCEMRMGCDAQLDAAYWPVVVTFITAVWLQCLAELAAGQVTAKWDLVSRLPRRWFLAGFFRQANELEQNAKEHRTGKLHLARGRLSFVLTAVQRTGMQNVFLLNFIDKCSLQHAWPSSMLPRCLFVRWQSDSISDCMPGHKYAVLLLVLVFNRLKSNLGHLQSFGPKGNRTLPASRSTFVKCLQILSSICIDCKKKNKSSKSFIVFKRLSRVSLFWN